MKNRNNTAVLLLNVGTPDSPKVSDVRRYLSQFLNDKRVIDIPYVARKILVNLIIVPFRAPKSAKLYKQLWTAKGSPLVFHTADLVNKLNSKADDSTKFFFAMRYQNPSIKTALGQIRKEGFKKILLLPMFPQYASSTNATALEAVYHEISSWQVIPEIESINQFYDHPAFIRAYTKRIKSYNPSAYDHVVLSYHGLPVRHVQKIHPENSCETCNCEKQLPDFGAFCYKATSFETSRILAGKLNLSDSDYTVSFQSRLSKNWLMPFTDKEMIRLAKEGKKKVLIAAPSFVTDCLETVIELGYEYKALFTENGGEELTMVESLNATDIWADALYEICGLEPVN